MSLDWSIACVSGTIREKWGAVLCSFLLCGLFWSPKIQRSLARGTGDFSGLTPGGGLL